MIATRDQLHRLVDDLPDEQLAAAARALRRLRETKSRPTLEDLLANAPIDDEPVTDEDRVAIQEGLDDIEAGRLLTTDELRRRLGLPPLEAGSDDPTA